MKRLIFIKKRPATLNLVPGERVYDEKLIKKNGKEYRVWNPKKSKLAAALVKGLKNFPFKEDSKVLYLGAASGTTVSHVSDICANGRIYAIDVAPRVLRQLVFVAEKRKNLYPILADANEAKYPFVEKVDIIYEDVAQPNQAEILIKNAQKYLKKNGYAIIAVKARSIKVNEKPSKIFKEVEKELNKYFKVIERVRLDPYEKDHMLFVCKA